MMRTHSILQLDRVPFEFVAAAAASRSNSVQRYGQLELVQTAAGIDVRIQRPRAGHMYRRLQHRTRVASSLVIITQQRIYIRPSNSQIKRKIARLVPHGAAGTRWRVIDLDGGRGYVYKLAISKTPQRLNLCKCN